MASIRPLIPFILYYEAGLSRHYTELPFEEMFEKARKTGFANDPDDAGGATMCGITIGTYRTYCTRKRIDVPSVYDLKTISAERWLDVLKTLYWDRWRADEIESQPLANTLVDWVWSSGNNGIKIPQRILGVKADGIVGVQTLGALNSAEPEDLFAQIHQARVNFIDNIIRNRPSQKKFERGWKRRLDAITYNGLKYQ